MIFQLEASNIWLADGIFKLTPKAFYQLYTIHIEISDIAPACVYALLPNKTRAVDGISRATSSAEDWHFWIQAFFNCSHPRIWKLLRCLQKDCALQKLNFMKAISGNTAPRERKYRELDNKIQNILLNSNNTQTIMFLRAMASLTS